MFTYKILNFPTIPPKLIESLDINSSNIQFDNNNLNQQYTVTKNNEEVKPAHYQRFNLTAELTNWIRNNIRDDFYNCGYSVTKDSAHHLPHVDAIGDYKINYIVNTGGNNVVTSFYQTPDQLPAGYRPSKFEELELVDQFTANEGQWVMINTKLIHGVSNLTSPRSIITLTFCNQ